MHAAVNKPQWVVASGHAYWPQKCETAPERKLLVNNVMSQYFNRKFTGVNVCKLSRSDQGDIFIMRSVKSLDDRCTVNFSFLQLYHQQFVIFHVLYPVVPEKWANHWLRVLTTAIPENSFCRELPVTTNPSNHI